MRRTIIFQCSAHIQTIVIFFFLSQQVNTEKYIHPLLLLLLWLWLCSNRKITIWTPGFFFFLFFLMEGGNNINRAADDCCLVSIFTSVEFLLLFKLRYRVLVHNSNSNSSSAATATNLKTLLWAALWEDGSVDAYHPAALRRLPNGAAANNGSIQPKSWWFMALVYLPPAVRPFPPI